jgi:molybdate transport system permease protein
VISSVKIVCALALSFFLFVVACLVLADVSYLAVRGYSFGEVVELLSRPEIIRALRLSLATSLTTLLLVMLTAVPIGYALSRFRFRGHTLANTMIDVPIVLPPVVMGISLLAFFSFGVGAPIKEALSAGGVSLVSGIGIVMCQYLVSISYCIRSIKTAFDGIDQELEQVARASGCSDWQVFWRVSLPLARNGVIAGGVMAWARGIGVFGPLMVFIGTGPRVMVLPTTLWLELSIGNLETSIAIALIMLGIAGAALALVHWLAPEGTAI